MGTWLFSLMNDKMQWLALGMTPSPKQAQGCWSARSLVHHSGSLTPYLPSAPAFSALCPSDMELMLTLYREANSSRFFLPYPSNPAASNPKQYDKHFQYQKSSFFWGQEPRENFLPLPLKQAWVLLMGFSLY